VVAASRVIAYVEGLSPVLSAWLRFCHAPQQFYSRTDIERIGFHIHHLLTPLLVTRKQTTDEIVRQMVWAVMMGYQHQAHNGSSQYLTDKHMRQMLGMVGAKNYGRDVGMFRDRIIEIMKGMDYDAQVVRTKETLDDIGDEAA
jgi:predicted ATP-dependent protease